MADIAIIGTGIAGVSAALTAKARNKDVLLIGTGCGGKIAKAEKVLNYPGLPSVSGEELSERMKRQLEEQNIPITEDRIIQIYAMGGNFALQGKSGSMYEAKAVILALGVVNVSDIKGEAENVGMGVSFCATCDAPLYKGKTAAVIAYSADEENEVKLLSEVADKIIFFPVYKNCSLTGENIETVSEKPVEIAKFGKKVITADNEYPVDGVFVLRESVSAARLINGLETEKAHIITEREMKTNIPGIFACGDITGKPYQLAKAAGEGNIAALSAAAYLDK